MIDLEAVAQLRCEQAALMATLGPPPPGKLWSSPGQPFAVTPLRVTGCLAAYRGTTWKGPGTGDHCVIDTVSGLSIATLSVRKWAFWLCDQAGPLFDAAMTCQDTMSKVQELIGEARKRGCP